MTASDRFPVSIEFFPPKTPEGVEKLRLVRQQLYALQPEFCSVTFGAGGSTQEGTFNAVRDILLLTVVLFASFFSKIFGGYLGGRLAGFSHAKSLTLGMGLNARGIMELVIANIALAKGFIDVSVFSILVLMALLTTILTPFLLKEGFRLIDRKSLPGIKTSA